MEKMEKIILEDVQDMSLVKEESASPISPKRPRTDWIENCSEKIRFDLSVTFQENNISVQKDADLLCTSECWCSRHEKPHEREDTEITATPITGSTSLLPENEHEGPPLVTAEGCASLLVQDEQPEVTKRDKLSSYSLDDAVGELAKFHTVPDAAPDTSSHPDCKLLLESLEDEPPGGCNLPDGNGDERKKAQCSVHQSKVFSPTSGDEEITCQHGYTPNERQNDAVFCDTWSQSAKVEPCIQKMEDDSTSTFLSDYTNSSFKPNVENQSGTSDQGVKIEEEKLELLICENEYVTVSETKGQVNENSMNKNAIHCETECAEGSAVDNDENVNLEADVFSGAKGEHAAGEMIAQARRETADHTAEAPAPARISQESAEGDNDVSPFSVIDPAIWSETDSEAARGRSSQCTAGAELSPSLTVGEMKMPLLLSDSTLPHDASFLTQTRQLHHPCRTQPCEDEKEGFCQTCSPSTNATHLKTGNEERCLLETCRSSSPKCPPVQHGRQESLETVGHSTKEHNLSGCIHANLENLKALVFHGLDSEPLKIDGSTKIKREESPDENGKSEEIICNQGHKDAFKMLELNRFGHRSASTGSPNLCSKTEITVEKERTDEARSVGGEILVITNNRHQQENQKQAAMTRAFPDCVSECSERSRTDSSRDSAYTLPARWDAVVPGPREANPSYRAPTIAPALNCSDTLPPVPSAFTFADRVPSGFDTFQRIQLSLEDDDRSDYSGSNSPLHTSLSGQGLLYHPILEAENTNQHEVAPEEEEGKDVERFKCHTENTKNVGSDYSCNDVPNLTTTPIRWPQQHINSECVVSPSDVCDGSAAAHLQDEIEFDTKRQFDMVLKELHLYFEISVSDFISSGGGSVPEQCSDVTKASEEETSEEFFGPDLIHHKNTASDAADGEHSLDLCERDPVLYSTRASGDGEQEVPLGTHGEASPSVTKKHRESPEMELKREMWSPSFMCQPFYEQVVYKLPEQHKRLKPLETCTRPIRIGLSKRARTKRLHPLHLYK